MLKLSTMKKSGVAGLALLAGSGLVGSVYSAQWPSRLVAPYIDTGLWPPYDYAALAEQTGLRYFHLGFITAKSAGGCRGAWAGGIDATASAEPGDGVTYAERIRRLRALGGDVILSFGGAVGVFLQESCSSADALAAEVLRIANTYEITRLDFDIEGGSLGNAEASQRLAQALAIVSASSPGIQISYTLPVLPSGLSSAAVTAIQLAVANDVPLASVNVMAMDYGSYYSGDMGQYAIQAVDSVKAQLQQVYSQTKGRSLSDAEAYQLVGCTPMLGVNDVVNNVFTLEAATTLVAYAQSVGVGLVSYWSVQRDVSGGSGVSQSNYDFAKIFLQLSGAAAIGFKQQVGPTTSSEVTTTEPTSVAGGDGGGSTNAGVGGVVGGGVCSDGWARCGGIGWDGPTSCCDSSAFKCTYISEWYSNCQPVETSGAAAASSVVSFSLRGRSSSSSSPASAVVASACAGLWGSCSESTPCCDVSLAATALVCASASEYAGRCIPE